MRGTKAKPQLGGKLHAREIERFDEPLKELPPARGWVSPDAEDAWRTLGEAAIKAGTLCASDLPSLAVAAQLWHLYAVVRARAYEEPGAVRDAANVAGKLTILLQQLGLTPRARQLVTIQGTRDEEGGESAFAVAARLRQNSR